MSAVYVKGRLITPRRTVMSSKKVLIGFDYRKQKEVEHTRQEWRSELQNTINHGGFRRHEHGETFGHDSKGLIEFEVYANISL